MHHFGIKKASLSGGDGSKAKQIQKTLKSIKTVASENIKPKKVCMTQILYVNY